jgi:hypothetical protein
MSVGVRFDLVIFHATDRAVDLQDGKSDIVNVCDAVLAQGALQFVRADMLSRHVRFDSLSIMNQKTRLALNDVAKGAIGAGKSPNKVIQHQQSGSCDNAADQRSIRTSHRILYGIGKKEKQSQVERSHLPHFAFTTEAYADQYDKIDHARAQRDLQHSMPTLREKHSVQLAVTGVGAFFGVLKYPVAFFLSTLHTTSSKSR